MFIYLQKHTYRPNASWLWYPTCKRANATYKRDCHGLALKHNPPKMNQLYFVLNIYFLNVYLSLFIWVYHPKPPKYTVWWVWNGCVWKWKWVTPQIAIFQWEKWCFTHFFFQRCFISRQTHVLGKLHHLHYRWVHYNIYLGKL